MPKPPTRRSKQRQTVKGELPSKAGKTSSDLSSRAEIEYSRLRVVLSWLRPVPQSWIEEQEDVSPGTAAQTLQPIACESYAALQKSWQIAMKWREDLDDVLSVMLSVALSTIQQGDQLFCMVIGDAGSGKTRLCDAMLVSPFCYPLEHLTGFFSGFKASGDSKDYSLINRVNGKLMITPEGDTMMSNPKFSEIMAQQRRIFDGSSGATYKNSDEDIRYTGLRTPWIIAGTPALLDSDQTRLGDRFLKVFVESPTEAQRREILNRISRSAFEAVRCVATGDDHVGEHMVNAYQLTGGYVNWLRENNHLLAEIHADDRYLTMCEFWGDFISYLRSRPAKSEDSAATREQPTRLTNQLVRLMCCMTVVLNRKEVDDEVMRRVRRVTLDSSKGIALDICDILLGNKNQYTATKSFQARLDYNKQTVERQLRLMKQIGALRLSTEDPTFEQKTKSPYWKMTPRMRELMEYVKNFKQAQSTKRTEDY